MARLIDDTGSKLLETTKVLLGHPEFSAELATEIRRKGGADRAVNALLREFQHDESPTPTPFPIWKTLRIGGKSKDQLIAEIEAKGMNTKDWACDMMNNEAFTTSLSLIELKLVRITVAKLGFEINGSTANIWYRARYRGLTLCPAEVGPHLLLADAQKAKGDVYSVAMEPITGSDSELRVFGVSNGQLFSVTASPTSLWNPIDSLVFVASGK